MKLLAIDTAFETCSVALWQDGDVLERHEHAPRGHAQLLLPWVEAVLAEAQQTLAALDAIAFSRGPGSFTSLRIGIGVVQGLAFGADVPVLPVSSLRTTAQQASTQGVSRACVLMDARMDEVYTGCFELRDAVMMPMGEERVCAPEQALPAQPQQWHAVGNGCERFAPLAEAAFAAHLPAVWPRASTLARLAAADFSAQTLLAAEQAQPVYLRDKVAEKSAGN